jgi:Fungal specific transcription factor domain
MLPLYISNARVNHPRNGSPFENSLLESFLWEQLFSVACDLHAVSFLLDEHSQKRSTFSASTIEYFEDSFAAAQHGIAAFPHPTDSIDRSVMYYRQNCWRVAAFIYLNTATRELPNGGIMKVAMDRLAESLHHSDLSSTWFPYQDILLWVLFMGSCGAMNDLEKRWFVLEFQRVARSLNLNSVEEAHALLRTQLWRTCKLDEPLRDVWV